MPFRRLIAFLAFLFGAESVVGCGGSSTPTNTAPTEKQIQKEQKSGPGGPKSK
jgi:hypothetical protein